MALETHIQKYKQKYNITILLTTLAELPDLIRRLQAEIPKPSYIGIILANDENDLNSGYISPLLCSFGPNRLEFLIMNVIGADSTLARDAQRTLESFAPRENVEIAQGDRQADTSSYRTAPHLFYETRFSPYAFTSTQRDYKSLFKESTIVPLPSRKQNFRANGPTSNKSFVETRKILRFMIVSVKNQKRHSTQETVETFREEHTQRVAFSAKSRILRTIKVSLEDLWLPRE